MSQECLIYIHGVSPEPNYKHDRTYSILHNGISQLLPPSSPWHQATRCDVEWGWNFDRQSPPQGDRLLAEAQEMFGKPMLELVEKTGDFTINPLRMLLPTLREQMIKGFADMFYYVSPDGKSSIRAAVASQIMRSIKPILDRKEPISLTFFGHSAGSVIAFDLLFYLFVPPAEIRERQFIDKEQVNNAENAEEVKQDIDQLREFINSGRLRVRRLITFGSPIPMLAFRSDPVLQILTDGKKLDYENYGFSQNPAVFGAPLSQPRWINFWDKDDMIAWPVSPLFPDNQKVVQDIYIDVSDQISQVHNKYWESEKMHQEIAKIW